MTTVQPATRYFDDVNPGDALGPEVQRPDEVQLFAFSAITWDTHRTHWDSPFSKDVDKLPGILVHGHLQAAFLTQLVTRWAGPRGKLARISYQNRGMSVPGDTLTCYGKVDSKAAEEDESVATVNVQVWIENQRKETTTAGQAIVELPRRNQP